MLQAVAAVTWKEVRQYCSAAPSTHPSDQGSKYGTPHDWPCCCDVQDSPGAPPGTVSFAANGGRILIKVLSACIWALILGLCLQNPHVEGPLAASGSPPDLSFPADCDKCDKMGAGDSDSDGDGVCMRMCRQGRNGCLELCTE